MHDDADYDFISRNEAADIADVSTCTIDRWLREPGGPPRQTFRRRVRISQAGFMGWLVAQVKEAGR
jgi:hypothetical protein